MKTKLIIVAIGMLTVMATTLNAQEVHESRVKILPASMPGVIKVLFAMEASDPVEIQFVTRDGIVGSDVLKGFPKGFLRRYDVNRISNEDFWIQIKSAQLALTYRVTPSKDRKTYEPYLEKATYTNDQLLVKGNN